MKKENTNIFVSADFKGFFEPALVGILSAIQAEGEVAVQLGIPRVEQELMATAFRV